MATTVRITETYDMKTTVNKLGLIGIHTPSNTQIRNLYGGLVKNHKFMRFIKCDVAAACASVLPADPLQVGVSAGEVAPEDMFNPILYKAVTNESFDTLVSRIYANARPGALGSLTKGDLDLSADDTFKTYYALLSENGKFRKAMPQSGFVIRSLTPICHTLISTYGNVAPIGNKQVLAADGENETSVPELSEVNSVTDALVKNVLEQNVVFRGKSVKMPKIPLHYEPTTASTIENFSVPEIFVAAIIVPPARLHEFYYRMRVTWTIRFEQPCSLLDDGSVGVYTYNGQIGYYKSYNYESSKSDLDVKDSSVDADNVDINKIMES